MQFSIELIRRTAAEASSRVVFVLLGTVLEGGFTLTLVSHLNAQFFFWVDLFVFDLLEDLLGDHLEGQTNILPGLSRNFNINESKFFSVGLGFIIANLAPDEKSLLCGEVSLVAYKHDDQIAARARCGLLHEAVYRVEALSACYVES